MSPVSALDRRVFEARAFRYIPDHDKGADWIAQLAADYFNTPRETEDRRGGDCDDQAVWAIVRGYELVAHLPAEHRGRWSLVLGEVKQAGQWSGHAWVELLVGDVRWWADPTWGWTCDAPGAHGFPATRQARRLFPFDGLVFGEPIDVLEVA